MSDLIEMLKGRREEVARDCECQCFTADYDEAIAEITALRQQLSDERSKRCGTCADWRQNTVAPEYGYCQSKVSKCNRYALNYEAAEWPADHGCPAWRGKETK